MKCILSNCLYWICIDIKTFTNVEIKFGFGPNVNMQRRLTPKEINNKTLCNTRRLRHVCVDKHVCIDLF